MKPKQTTHERFMSKFAVNESTGCWEWTAGLFKGTGYACFYYRGNRKPGLGHRYAYEYFKGPIPAGHHIDHLCRNRKCVNPEHLEPVTAKENILRGEGPAAVNAKKTHCRRGHEFTPENTSIMIRTDGRPNRLKRRCKKCMIIAVYGENGEKKAAIAARQKAIFDSDPEAWRAKRREWEAGYRLRKGEKPRSRRAP